MVLIVIILWLLCSKKKADTSHHILIIIFGLFLFSVLFFYAMLHKIKWLVVATFLVEDPVVFLMGPLIYLYVKSLFDNTERLFRRHWLHFAPFLIYFTFISIPVWCYILTNKWIVPYHNLVEKYDYLIPFQILFLIVYSLISLGIWFKYNRALMENYSSIEERDFIWVRNLLAGTLVVSVIDLSTTIYESIYGVLEWETGILTIISLIILIIFLGYNGVSKSRILIPDFLIERENKQRIDVIDSPQERQSVLNYEEIGLLKVRLETIMENEKVFLDENLTLGKLASSISTTDKKLSTLLNQHMNTSFYNYVNCQRVEEVKEMMSLEKYNNYTLLGIANEAGFKSKTSFNRIFKKLTGLSPSEYKKGLR